MDSYDVYPKITSTDGELRLTLMTGGNPLTCNSCVLGSGWHMVGDFLCTVTILYLLCRMSLSSTVSWSFEWNRQIETTAFLSHTLPFPDQIPSRPAIYINLPSSTFAPVVLSQIHRSKETIMGPTCLALLTNMYPRCTKIMCFLSSSFLPFLQIENVEHLEVVDKKSSCNLFLSPKWEHVWRVMQGRLMTEAVLLPGRLFPTEAAPAKNVCSVANELHIKTSTKQ